MKYAHIELHSHTIHSDGNFSVQELVTRATREGYDALVISDHNTQSALEEGQKYASQLGIIIVPAIEWTTFYGHMLVIGADRLVDWRRATIDNIDNEIKDIKQANGIVGIAHPFAVGSPICTGCRWMFKVKQWEQIDFIEIWNSHSPQHTMASERAYLMWKKLIEKGYRIACSAGRDWHRDEPPNTYIGQTIIAYEETLTRDRALQSLREGRSYITLKPRVSIEISQDNSSYYIGDNCLAKEMTINLVLDDRANMDLKEIVVFNNQNEIMRLKMTEEDHYFATIRPNPGFVRLEILGKVDQELCRVVITNPVYIH